MAGSSGVRRLAQSKAQGRRNKSRSTASRVKRVKGPSEKVVKVKKVKVFKG